jgi:hypothetical protein
LFLKWLVGVRQLFEKVCVWLYQGVRALLVEQNRQVVRLVLRNRVLGLHALSQQAIVLYPVGLQGRVEGLVSEGHLGLVSWVFKVLRSSYVLVDAVSFIMVHVGVVVRVPVASHQVVVHGPGNSLRRVQVPLLAALPEARLRQVRRVRHIHHVVQVVSRSVRRVIRSLRHARVVRVLRLQVRSVNLLLVLGSVC